MAWQEAERISVSALGLSAAIREQLASGMAMSGQSASAMMRAAQVERPQEGEASHSADIPLDSWLRHALHGWFGATLSEPLPAELLKLASGAGAG